MTGKKSVAAVTLGCKVNAYDTESILARFREAGYEVKDFDGSADVYIVNTCTVTAVSDKKSRQMIRRAASKGGIVVVTGCFAQNNEREARSIPGVSIVAGIKERAEIVDIVENYSGASGIISRVTGYNKNKLIFDNMPVKGMTGRTRAFIKIQEGCENFCAYCIIPFARGPVRSRRIEDIAGEIRDVAASGVKEAVLTGISVASYGRDLGGVTLADALHAAAGVPGIERVRLSSVGPGAVTREFLNAIAELPQICGHIHLSLQSGCDTTLRRMNRRYTTDEYANAVEAIRSVRPDAAVTTDVITGFPGETEKDNGESRAFVERMRFAALHVFPYSRREGTAAADMEEQVPRRVKEVRAAQMIELGKRLKTDFINRLAGEVVPVLVEKRLDCCVYTGFTPHYVETLVRSREDLRGGIVSVRIEGASGERALGQLVT